jgi:pimeloyl-ACP methyl ester carboxylesterase
MPNADEGSGRLSISGVEIAVERRGRGAPLLLLYGEEALELEAPVIEELARDHELILPSPPGFGASERPEWITNADDISYLYLDLVERLGLESVAVLGFSFGGWIAAEMATKDCSFISKLVLVAPYGIKVGGPFDRDVQDVWLLHPDKVMGLKWFDKTKGKCDFAAMPDDKLAVIARNAESFARFGWEPYMHNPKLKHRLHRIKVPTLLVWGENDGLVTPDYGRAYSKLVPGSRLAVIREAGHFPHIEQPQAFMQELNRFLR